ncbi:hypothetical protein BJ508DRAFT_36698 [Ascobolus immersus RN42]|uniref:Uncharacterized protein n=1 Tax=Ascobolus immersus RN42 TaxID=1160509 RepID=A0A3N4IFD8_ASCIM|nr:hypothetical protein BJ508DRAFT_36698 [Ascobolus immersus RN42]
MARAFSYVRQPPRPPPHRQSKQTFRRPTNSIPQQHSRPPPPSSPSVNNTSSPCQITPHHHTRNSSSSTKRRTLHPPSISISLLPPSTEPCIPSHSYHPTTYILALVPPHPGNNPRHSLSHIIAPASFDILSLFFNSLLSYILSHPVSQRNFCSASSVSNVPACQCAPTRELHRASILHSNLLPTRLELLLVRPGWVGQAFLVIVTDASIFSSYSSFFSSRLERPSGHYTSGRRTTTERCWSCCERNERRL